MALDLLGIPLAERATPPWDNDEERAELVALSIQELEERLIGVLIELDAKERALARQGIELEPGQATRTLRCYEQSCMSGMRWAWNRLDALKRNPVEASETTTTATASAAIHAPSRPSPAAPPLPPPPSPSVAVAPTPAPPSSADSDRFRLRYFDRVENMPFQPNEANGNLGGIGRVEGLHGDVRLTTPANGV